MSTSRTWWISIYRHLITDNLPLYIKRENKTISSQLARKWDQMTNEKLADKGKSFYFSYTRDFKYCVSF